MKYRTVQGDVLDAICTTYYGLDQFDLAKIYNANIDLASFGAVLPSGLLIELPDEARTEPVPQLIRLVD